MRSVYLHSCRSFVLDFQQACRLTARPPAALERCRRPVLARSRRVDPSISRDSRRGGTSPVRSGKARPQRRARRRALHWRSGARFWLRSSAVCSRCRPRCRAGQGGSAAAQFVTERVQDQPSDALPRACCYRFQGSVIGGVDVENESFRWCGSHAVHLYSMWADSSMRTRGYVILTQAVGARSSGPQSRRCA